MMIFSEDTEIARSILAMIASYSASLLEAGKSKRMAYDECLKHAYYTRVRFMFLVNFTFK